MCRLASKVVCSECHHDYVISQPSVFSIHNHPATAYWLPFMVAQVWAQVWSYGICGGQSGAGADCLRVLWFPLPILIPPIAPQSPSSIIWGWYNRPVVAAVPSGLSLTPVRIIIKKLLHVVVVQTSWKSSRTAKY
jgi:hypothetical protein